MTEIVRLKPGAKLHRNVIFSADPYFDRRLAEAKRILELKIAENKLRKSPPEWAG